MQHLSFECSQVKGGIPHAADGTVYEIHNILEGVPPCYFRVKRWTGKNTFGETAYFGGQEA